MSVRYRGRSPQKNNASSSNIITRYDDEKKYKRKYNPHANSKSVFLLKVINMRTTPLVALVFNRRHTATATKEAAVELRVSYKKQQKFMATGIKLLPKHWHKGTVVARVDALQINQTLGKLLIDVRKVILQMMEGPMSLEFLPFNFAGWPVAHAILHWCQSLLPSGTILKGAHREC